MLQFPKVLASHAKALASPQNHASCLIQQARNTWILKRVKETPLHKKSQRPRPLTGKDFLYKVVDHLDYKKKEPLDLILTKFVTGIGNVGTRVSMHPNRAYKLLLLPKLADYATPENIEKYTKLAMTETVEAPFSSATVERTIKHLSHMRISMVMSKDVPWTLEKWHIRANLRKAGIAAAEDAITMPERSISGPNLDIQGKQFCVTVTINNRERIEVKCVIHHWTPERAARIFVPEFWKLPSEPIFPEDTPTLDSPPASSRETSKTDL